MRPIIEDKTARVRFGLRLAASAIFLAVAVLSTGTVGAEGPGLNAWPGTIVPRALVALEPAAEEWERWLFCGLMFAVWLLGRRQLPSVEQGRWQSRRR